MKPTQRRVFLMKVVAGSAALAGAGHAAASVKKVEENESKAVSLGYRHDSTKVDKAKFPKHSPNEKCSNCMAWLGKPSDAWAECDLMADRMVAAGGWCSSYVKAK